MCLLKEFFACIGGSQNLLAYNFQIYRTPGGWRNWMDYYEKKYFNIN
jgi:hypothetical protein